MSREHPFRDRRAQAPERDSLRVERAEAEQYPEALVHAEHDADQQTRFRAPAGKRDRGHLRRLERAEAGWSGRRTRDTASEDDEEQGGESDEDAERGEKEIV